MSRTDLGAGAVQEYREAGWLITPHGHVDPGIHAGPCGRCHTTCLRYGPAGRVLCRRCEAWSR